MGSEVWERVGEQRAASWYLHPLVAVQKREAHLDLVARWTVDLAPGLVLKTDLFEEAFGDDAFFAGAFPAGAKLAGMDMSLATTRKARDRFGVRLCTLVTDVRQMGMRDGSIDLILSNSTLDHFATEGEFTASIRELTRVLRPGGRMILTLDNPHNPMYPLLRWVTGRRWAPFPLGYTPQPAKLMLQLGELGLEVRETAWLIHNPRLISTVIFQALERTLGRRGDGLARLLLRLFEAVGRTGLRRWSACFYAFRIDKPARADSRACEAS
jgi:SAM-dependent methyltransferase